MKNLSKIITKIWVAGTVLLPTAALAQKAPWGLKGADEALKKVDIGNAGRQELPALIGNIINVVLGFLGIILLGYLLYAGFLWMTSGGDDKKVTEAKTMIRNAIVGIVIIIAAVAISNFVISALVQATGS